MGFPILGGQLESAIRFQLVDVHDLQPAPWRQLDDIIDLVNPPYDPKGPGIELCPLRTGTDFGPWTKIPDLVIDFKISGLNPGIIVLFHDLRYPPIMFSH